MNERAERLGLIALLLIVGTALVITGNYAGYWFYVGVVWVLIGVL